MSQPIKPAELSWRQHAAEVVSGGSGGAAGITAAAPFMYFKQYFQLKAANPDSHPPFEKNPLKWFAGAKGLAAWMFPQVAFQFSMNDALQKRFSNNGQRELTSTEKLACSAATGAMISPMVNVQELIWQQQKMAPGKSATQVAHQIWTQHGAKGFCRGMGETLLREMVSASVLTYLVAENPIMAPLFGAAVSQPVDGRKTAKQADFTYKPPLKEMFGKKAFAGLVTGRVPVYLVFMNVAPFVKEKVKSLTSDD